MALSFLYQDNCQKQIDNYINHNPKRECGNKWEVGSALASVTSDFSLLVFGPRGYKEKFMSRFLGVLLVVNRNYLSLPAFSWGQSLIWTLWILETEAIKKNHA